MGWLRNLFRQRSIARDRGWHVSPSSGARTPRGGRNVCDICNENLRREDGYLLTTRQVVLTEQYWVAASSSVRAMISSLSLPPDAAARTLQDTMSSMVPQMAGQRTPWAVCQQCIDLFAVDRNAAHEYARTDTFPPGCGPVAPSECHQVAARTWGGPA